MTKKNKWWLNGGRGSGRTFRLLWETYENKIKELKKENAELKLELAKKADTNHSLVEQMADLESEIAELKERYSKVDIIGYDALKNLTKAKEIIKGLLLCCRNYPQENAEKVEQAEQFLEKVK